MNKTIKQFGWLFIISTPILILLKFPEPYNLFGNGILGGVLMYFLLEIDRLKEVIKKGSIREVKK